VREALNDTQTVVVRISSVLHHRHAVFESDKRGQLGAQQLKLGRIIDNGALQARNLDTLHLTASPHAEAGSDGRDDYPLRDSDPKVSSRLHHSHCICRLRLCRAICRRSLRLIALIAESLISILSAHRHSRSVTSSALQLSNEIVVRQTIDSIIHLTDRSVDAGDARIALVQGFRAALPLRTVTQEKNEYADDAEGSNVDHSAFLGANHVTPNAPPAVMSIVIN
jgi:hypothetical protein